MDLPQVGLTWIISVSVTVLLLTYLWLSRRNPKYPPCPLRPWPILGNLLQLNKDPREQFATFRKQYGDIYSIYLGPKHVVILNGLDVIKEALVKQGDDFSDRAVIFFDVGSDTVKKGITASDGAVWKEQRAFAMATLRRFGLGNNTLADKIQEEVNHFMELLETFKGEPKNIHGCTRMSVSNIICSIIVGQRYEYDDAEFLRIQDLLTFIQSKIKGTAIINVFPWLKFVPGDLFCCKIIEKYFKEFFNMFGHAHIDENENVAGEPGNYIAAYLQEIRRKQESGEKTHLDKNNLLRSVLDLIAGGTDTVAVTLDWIFLYMVNYPKVQENIFQEINKVVGLDRAPCMQDKAKLIYLSATIMEVQRLASLVPLGLPRNLTREVNLRGYIDSVLHDTSLWGDDTNTFRPERFIAEDGSLLLPESWIPFSIGRRICLGESLAKMELFIFVSKVFQRFQILPANPKTIPPFRGELGIFNTPLPYELRFVCRK